ncbi:MAG: hypothetical protein AB7D51_09080 [Desulfovibrionaceae bacterium]
MKKIGAGLGELWEKAPAGIGEAVEKGWEGAKEAVGKTAEAYATNKDLQKYTAIALGAGALPIVAAAAPEVLPSAGRAVASHVGKIKNAATGVMTAIGPDKVQKVIEVAEDVWNPMPPAKTKYGMTRGMIEGAINNYEYYANSSKNKQRTDKNQTQPVHDNLWGR